MLSTSMFVIGFIIFSLYLVGLIYMINWGHKSQEKDETNDSEINTSKK
mgnify:CR=1 FL=1|jgi:hypothetical protein